VASTSVSQLLSTGATVYGVLAALSVLLQARQMLAQRSSCEVSGRFFASYAGGYVIWLFYGLSVGSLPLIVVDAVGFICAGLTLAVALSLRGSLLRPSTWTSCGAIPVSTEGSELVPTAIPNAVARARGVAEAPSGHASAHARRLAAADE
jgi:MtN3 and saliva related transmembrane protein